MHSVLRAVRRLPVANTSWNLPAPPGFRGLHPDVPVTVYYRHLPHWRQDGATYFVTFRLADSLPQAKRNELKRLKREWLAGRRSALRNGITKVGRNAFRPTFQGLAEEEWEDLARIVMEKVERWLDQGMGECWLKLAELRQVVIECLHHLDGDAYELGCYVTMPKSRARNPSTTAPRRVSAGEDPPVPQATFVARDQRHPWQEPHALAGRELRSDHSRRGAPLEVHPVHRPQPAQRQTAGGPVSIVDSTGVGGGRLEVRLGVGRNAFRPTPR